MFIKNSVKLAVVAVSVMSAASAVVAQETATGTATVTVQNAFDLAEVAPLSFGTLRVSDTSSSSAGGVTFELLNDGTTRVKGTPTDYAGSVLVPGTLGEFAITNAAPFANLKVTNDATDLTITAGGAVSAALTTPVDPTVQFEFKIPLANTMIVGGSNDGSAITATGNVQTDATGAVGFRVGGELSYADDGTSTSPPDGTYSGTYQVTVSY